MNSNTIWAGMGILVRNNLQNLKVSQLEMSDVNLKYRVTHLQIHANSVLNFMNIYAPSFDGKK